jgi:predicted hotdog family 3-hydroxylacyl-ACP dehydratase
MCLLDAVDSWDETTIRCRASTHRDEQNPLRVRGRLTVSAGLEYAAQAMGAHVGLVNGGYRSENHIGFVGSVRDVVFSIDRLDDLAQDITVEAIRLLEGEGSYMYRFVVAHDGCALIEGRAAIFVKDAS